MFGTRPEAIKLAPVIAEIGRRRTLRGITCSTGQHREMLGQALRIFGITPDHDLGVMEADQRLEAVTAAVIERTALIIEKTKPGLVIVQGDTASAMAVAL